MKSPHSPPPSPQPSPWQGEGDAATALSPLGRGQGEGVLRWKPYPAYKDSGVSWLGEMPEHWNVTRLRFCAINLDSRRIPLNAEERASMQGSISYWGANGVLDQVDDWLFDEPLVLLGEDGAPFFEKNKNVAFYVTGKVWVNNHIHVLRVKSGIDPRFIVHALNIVDYRSFIDGSTRDKLTQGDMNDIPIQLPTHSEQLAIATFLDRETAKIDALIAKKQRLIELLQEKRSALISQAVTRGLNPLTPLKDSGEKWYRDIPKNWEIIRIKSLAGNDSSVVQTGPFGAQLHAGDYVDEGIPLVLIKNVRDLYIDDSDIPKVSQEDADRLSMYRLEVGDVVFSRVGSIGRIALVTEREKCWLISGQMLRLRIRNPRLDSHYSVYALTSQEVISLTMSH